MRDIDLTFPSYPIGTHQIPWNLKILLFKGAAGIPRKLAIYQIDEGKYGASLEDRLPLISAFHEAISSMISLGKSRDLVESSLEVLWRFFAWSDDQAAHICKETIIDIFKSWTEYLIHRSHIQKEISAMYAYRQASKMANLIAKALRFQGKRPGGSLLLQTRMRKPSVKKRVLGTQADKQNLSQTFEFGQTLTKICASLDLATVRGRLPILINISDETTLTLAGSLMILNMDISAIKSTSVKRSAKKARAPLQDSESLFDGHKRSAILNLRIEAELLIFIAQTGMNLTQAALIEKESYRWKSNGDDLEVFRVYKGRRSGEAIFRCFKTYRKHLERYLKWLDETGFSENDKRLFPLLSRGMVPATGAKVKFTTTRPIFKKYSLRFIGPQQLRKTRVNWLLRRSGDLSLTAEQMAHEKEVLLRDYERPHHQSAAAEIVKFHSATDPAFPPPGPGICIDECHQPEKIEGMPQDAPKPDCISPEGCLFCVKQRILI